MEQEYKAGPESTVLFDDVDIQQRRSVRFQGVFQALDGVLAGNLNSGIMRIMSMEMGA